MSSKITINPSPSVSAVGLASLVVGLIMIIAGGSTWGLVSQQLANERITVSQDAPFLAGKANVNDPFSAFAQAMAIDKHARDMSGGKTYAELDQSDPVRADVMNASFLRSSLFASVVAFGVAAFVVGLGVLFMLTGWGLRRLAGGPPVVIETEDEGDIYVDGPNRETFIVDSEQDKASRSERRARKRAEKDAVAEDALVDDSGALVHGSVPETTNTYRDEDYVDAVVSESPDAASNFAATNGSIGQPAPVRTPVTSLFTQVEPSAPSPVTPAGDRESFDPPATESASHDTDVTSGLEPAQSSIISSETTNTPGVIGVSSPAEAGTDTDVYVAGGKLGETVVQQADALGTSEAVPDTPQATPPAPEVEKKKGFRFSRSERALKESRVRADRDSAITGMTGTIPIVGGTRGANPLRDAETPISANSSTSAPTVASAASARSAASGASGASSTSAQDIDDDPHPQTGAIGWQSPQDRLGN